MSRFAMDIMVSLATSFAIPLGVFIGLAAPKFRPSSFDITMGIICFSALLVVVYVAAWNPKNWDTKPEKENLP